jgi:hypothetical protein
MLISAIDLPIMGNGAKRRLDASTFARRAEAIPLGFYGLARGVAA